MAGPSRTLTLAYVANTLGLRKGNKEAESSLSKVGASFRKLGKAAAVGTAAAGAALIAFGKKAVSAASEAEAAQVRLATILRNTGLATEDQITALNKQAAALEKVGVASAGNITVLQGQLATFDLTADTIRELTPAIADYVVAEKGATASAGDYQAAANGLAQALQGNFASLTRTGFVLDDVTKDLISNGTEAERAAALVEVLGSTYAGFNETARETAEGQLVALKNSFQTLTETIGTALLPAMRFLTDAALRVVERLQELWEIHGPRIIDFLRNAFERFKEVAATLREQFEPPLRDAITRVRDFITAIREWWQQVSPGVIDSFKRLKEPIMLLWENIKIAFEQTKNIIGAFRSGESDGQGFQRFIDFLVDSITLLLGVLNRAIELLNKLRDVILRIVESAGFQTLLRGVSAVASGIGGIVGRIAGRGGDPGIPDIPSASSGTTNINVNAGIGDPAAIAREVQRTIRNENARAGTPAPVLAGAF